MNLTKKLIGKDMTPNLRESESNGILKLKSEKTFSEDNQTFMFPPKQRKSGKNTNISVYYPLRIRFTDNRGTVNNGMWECKETAFNMATDYVKTEKVSKDELIVFSKKGDDFFDWNK